MGWVNAEEYARATADPLAGASAGILQHMNADHGAAMVTLAARYAGLSGTEAKMTGVDRLGFTLRVKTADGVKGARINFPGEVRSGEETRGALVGMLRAS
jgi:putative heme iron utilization protein